MQGIQEPLLQKLKWNRNPVENTSVPMLSRGLSAASGWPIPTKPTGCQQLPLKGLLLGNGPWVAKLSDDGTSTGDGMLLAEMGETKEIGAGVAAVGDPPASEWGLETMAVWSSSGQLGELQLLDPPWSSSVPEGEGLREDGLDKSICSSPGGMHPQPEPPDLGTSRHTWVLGGLNEMQRGPLLGCRICNRWTGRSSCAMSIRFWSRSVWAVSATTFWMPGICWAVSDTPAVKATAHNSRACAVRAGERVPTLLLMYATAVVLPILKRICLSGEYWDSWDRRGAFRANVAARGFKTLMCHLASSTFQWPPVEIPW